MNLFLPGPTGRLQGLLWSPEGSAPRAAAVMAHPHPLHGGSMMNNVVHRAGRGLQAAGIAVLRFNFRGVGRSEGTHDGNGAEAGDYVAALDWLQERLPGLPLVAGGFSFGARTAMDVATRTEEERRIARVLLLAPPVLVYPCDELRRLTVPGLLLSAGRDEFGTAADVRARFPDLSPNLEVDEIPDVDHFFTGALPQLSERVRTWAERTFHSAGIDR